MESIKRFFRSIFKRQKKSQPDPGTTQPGGTGSEAAAVIDTATPNQPFISAQHHSKALPVTPTSPPATPNRPQESSKERGAASEAASAPTIPGAPGSEQKVGGGYVPAVSEPDVSPVRESAQVDALKEDQPPAPPPKEDTVDSATQVVPGEAAATAAAGSESQPQHTQSAHPPIDHIDEAKETNAPLHGMDAPSGEDKIPVMVEPPPIKPINAAPGMSATSGPLEDFPEGGEYRG